jgi:putative ABC transport system permease protein
MNRLEQDIRFALRGFARTPSFTVTAVLILAVGIGMAVAMFSVFDRVLVQELPVHDQDRVVQLYTYRGDPNADYYLRREDLRKITQASRTMRDVAGFAHWGAAEAPMLDGDRPLVVRRTTVTGNFFDVLGARAVIGRLIGSADEAPGAEHKIVLSHGAWHRLFGGDSGIVGRHLLEPYARAEYEIIGVAPPGLDYPGGVDMWLPNWQPSDKLSVIAIARLAPGAAVATARSEFLALMKETHRDAQYDGVRAVPVAQAIVGDVRPVLIALAAAVGLLLLIACVNVGNLLLLRASDRARELSVRRALGASAVDIARQLVVESTLLAVAGGALGLMTAVALIRLLVVLAPPQLPRLDAVALQGAPVLIAIVVTSVAIMLFGVVPAVIGSRGELAPPLRFDSRAGAEGRARRGVRAILVASQVALALVMLTGASLLVRSLVLLQSVPLGYNPDRLAIITASFPPTEYNDSAGKFSQAKLNALGERLLEQWRAVPGVAEATPIVVPPFYGSNIFVGRLDREGQPPEDWKSNPVVPVEIGGADYFRTFGIPIRAGRGFTEADDETGEKVAVVSEALARRVWPNENPIGKRIHYWSADSTTWRTVVGIAGDIHWRSLRESVPSVYLPWRQSYWQGSFAIRTRGQLAAVLPALRRATHEVSPVTTVWSATPMNDLLDKPLARPRLSAVLLGGFAFVSLLLAAMGLYGVMAAAVSGRTRELGVRAALGASPERLRWQVLREALGVAALGAGAGLIGALATSHLLSALLFAISPADPASLIGAAALLMMVAAIAAYVPARRATKINPVDALRWD